MKVDNLVGKLELQWVVSKAVQSEHRLVVMWETPRVALWVVQKAASTAGHLVDHSAERWVGQKAA